LPHRIRGGIQRTVLIDESIGTSLRRLRRNSLGRRLLRLRLSLLRFLRGCQCTETHYKHAREKSVYLFHGLAPFVVWPHDNHRNERANQSQTGSL
jgi:hypothetical protein